jgi:hypothetical protein
MSDKLDYSAPFAAEPDHDRKFPMSKTNFFVTLPDAGPLDVQEQASSRSRSSPGVAGYTHLGGASLQFNVNETVGAWLVYPL